MNQILSPDDFLWFAHEIILEWREKMRCRDWRISIEVVKSSDMETHSRTEIEYCSVTQECTIRFELEYWCFYDGEEDLLDALEKTVIHELSHLWFAQSNGEDVREHVCSMITSVIGNLGANSVRPAKRQASTQK